MHQRGMTFAAESCQGGGLSVAVEPGGKKARIATARLMRKNHWMVSSVAPPPGPKKRGAGCCGCVCKMFPSSLPPPDFGLSGPLDVSTRFRHQTPDVPPRPMSHRPYDLASRANVSRSASNGTWYRLLALLSCWSFPRLAYHQVHSKMASESCYPWVPKLSLDYAIHVRPYT